MPALVVCGGVCIRVSGTGKTATFAISILQTLDTSMKECQALILAPTRELAQQIQKVINALSEYMSIEVHACVGGTAVRDDITKLRNGVHVVVGTPGRVYDMINRRALRLQYVRLFVLDEVRAGSSHRQAGRQIRRVTEQVARL